METTSSYTLGIDIGGTFTDLVALNLSTGLCETEKVLTTPESPQMGVKNGLIKLLPRIGGGENISRVVHATTLFSNSVIERKGSKTGLVTSNGFKDTLELRRERKYDIYDLFLTFPQPLVSQDLRCEVPRTYS
jgi:N-methylhydantoinase A/oxoprolinase/acetone carboxylase beta subunit